MHPHISALHLEKYGPFDRLEATFNPGVNIIIGANASGKTSILRAITACVSNHSYSSSRWDKDTEIWLDYFGKQERIYRVGLSKGAFRTTAYRDGTSAIEGWTTPVAREGAMVVSPAHVENYVPELCPLFIGAYRKIEYVRMDGMKRELNGATMRSHYRAHSFQYLDTGSMPDIKQWLVNRYFMKNMDWAESESENLDHVTSILAKISPPGKEISFNRIERDMEPIFSINGRTCYLEELSSGFKSILSIVLSIVNWWEATCEPDVAHVANAMGTVAIDEIDAHLHPEWQLEVVGILRELFPNIQFLITTHSPHVVASASHGEVISLPNHDGIVNLAPINADFSGWRNDYILSDLMQMANVTEREAYKLVRIAKSAFDENDLRALAACLSRLREILHKDDPLLLTLRLQYGELLIRMGVNEPELEDTEA